MGSQNKDRRFKAEQWYRAHGLLWKRKSLRNGDLRWTVARRSALRIVRHRGAYRIFDGAAQLGTRARLDEAFYAAAVHAGYVVRKYDPDDGDIAGVW